MFFAVDVLKSDENILKEIITAQRQSAYVSLHQCTTFLCLFSKLTGHFTPSSTANIKALRGSLGALSVNKLSHIPKLQPISAVYENQ